MAPLFLVIGGFLAGLCVGSFLVTLATRWPSARASIVTGRSVCPHCGVTLRAIDLVPLVSWLALQGRCRRCQGVVPALYPLAELAAGLIGGLSVLLVPLPGALIVAGLGWWLLLSSLIDLRTMELPDSLTLALVLFGLAITGLSLWPVFGLAELELIDALAGVIAGYGIFWIINRAYRSWRGRDGLGLGDAKLLAAAGAWNGGQWLPEICLTASVVTLVIAMATGQIDDRFKAVPFGPGLALAAWLAFLTRQTL
ncbi:MAG: prepilin peptidase [Pseudomonadota bacterium]